MNTIEVLLLAWAAGLVLERRGDKIIIKGLMPETPPQLLEVLRANKPDLLAILSAAPHACAEHSPRNLHDEA